MVIIALEKSGVGVNVAVGEGVNVGGMDVAVNVAVGGIGVTVGTTGVAPQPASMTEIMVTIPTIGKSFLLSIFIPDSTFFLVWLGANRGELRTDANSMVG